MKTDRARALRGRLGRVVTGGSEDLQERVAQLELEVQECRALNVRLAELTDVVTELLLPVAARDEELVADVLERYRSGI